MVIIDQEKCIGCGRCVEDCSVRNLQLQDTKAQVKKECFQCGHCVAICPQNAVTITDYDMQDVEEYREESFFLDPDKLLHSIKFRRSIRDYKPEKVEKEMLSLLVQAGRYTATAKNTQSNGYVFVQEELEELKAKVWEYIDEIEQREGRNAARELLPYFSFNRRRKADPNDDYLFRNAPVVLFITSERMLDVGLAAQNMENMAVSLGLGVLYNGFLARIADANDELKKWLGIEGKSIMACMLLGYPNRQFIRTAPRKEAEVIWK